MSGPSGATKVNGSIPSTSRQQPAKASAQREVWKPQARCDVRPVSSSDATCPGRIPMSAGSQNGVWVKCTVRRSGRSWRSQRPTRARW